ncbi:hypothetical protein MMJ52_02340 [Enterococcus cecorum]|uniref:hypothetical protein n=1 Tax=Enterococcus cecorum TaxID=44008 RepID=UPI001FAD9D17|nr:hypothetical protein [Enterococcus cecorum]MCJ0543109.1 hypothetical protein [Enterococcus cecorum]MCJ0547608.1 hypothetical protein [Enterococcus cecorum]
MQKKFKIKGTALALTDLRATLLIEGPTSLTTITFDKELLEAYAEDYIKEHFEISEDGWIRRIENDETV